MKIATCHLKSTESYSQSRYHDTPKISGESHDDYERRTWREKQHYTPEKPHHILIPCMGFKQALTSAAKFLGLKIPGKGQKTWSKVFESGILIMDSPVLDITKDDTIGEEFFLNADGVRGSGKRVKRIMPCVPEWEATLIVNVLADNITLDVFRTHLETAGAFIGIGRFRPENGGFYGRFKVRDIEWDDRAKTE